MRGNSWVLFLKIEAIHLDYRITNGRGSQTHASEHRPDSWSFKLFMFQEVTAVVVSISINIDIYTENGIHH